MSFHPVSFQVGSCAGLRVGWGRGGGRGGGGGGGLYVGGSGGIVVGAERLFCFYVFFFFSLSVSLKSLTFF